MKEKTSPYFRHEIFFEGKHRNYGNTPLKGNNYLRKSPELKGEANQYLAIEATIVRLIMQLYPRTAEKELRINKIHVKEIELFRVNDDFNPKYDKICSLVYDYTTKSMRWTYLSDFTQYEIFTEVVKKACIATQQKADALQVMKEKTRLTKFKSLVDTEFTMAILDSSKRTELIEALKGLDCLLNDEEKNKEMFVNLYLTAKRQVENDEIARKLPEELKEAEIKAQYSREILNTFVLTKISK